MWTNIFAVKAAAESCSFRRNLKEKRGKGESTTSIHALITPVFVGVSVKHVSRSKRAVVPGFKHFRPCAAPVTGHLVGYWAAYFTPCICSEV